MKEVRILHQVSGRDADIHTRDDVLRLLREGGFYYDAGTIQVMGDVSYENEEGTPDWSEVLENAWVDSQNDTHPNYVETENGCIGTFQELVEEYGDYQEAEAEVKRLGGKVLPAVWNVNDAAGPGSQNHAFAQRSSMVGDLFIVEDVVFRAEGCGFKRIVGFSFFERHKGVKLTANPYAPGGEYDDGRHGVRLDPAAKLDINEAFDELITD